MRKKENGYEDRENINLFYYFSLLIWWEKKGEMTNRACREITMHVETWLWIKLYKSD